jgi:cytochrome c biogenesis protein CcmG, thiol:disulfide interchange protein DsbE
MITQQHGDAPQAGPGKPGLARAAWLALSFRLSRLVRLRALSRRAQIGLCAAVVAIAVIVGLILASAGAGPARPTGPAPLAKSFSLPAVGPAGGTVSLASYPGRPVVVNFFASWCAPCQRETPLLARYYASQHGRVVVIGVDSNDELAAALRFLQKAGVRYPVGSDPFPARTATSYGVAALPQTFFLNGQHRIVAHVLGAVTARVLAKDVALMNRRTTQDRG